MFLTKAFVFIGLIFLIVQGGIYEECNIENSPHHVLLSDLDYNVPRGDEVLRTKLHFQTPPLIQISQTNGDQQIWFGIFKNSITYAFYNTYEDYLRKKAINELGNVYVFNGIYFREVNIILKKNGYIVVIIYGKHASVLKWKSGKSFNDSTQITIHVKGHIYMYDCPILL
ncbi:hypothetical protein ACFFRR_010951 [Megaselia abdita]